MLDYLCESFPFALSLVRKRPPLLPDDLRYLGIRKPWVLGHNSGLIVLTIEYESCFPTVSQFFKSIGEEGN